jgi:signal transduction histidine kinase
MVYSPVKKLHVNTRFDEENIYVEFRDTGYGLDPAEADNLFTPFYSTKPPVGEAQSGDPTGTGLGLSSTYQLINKYHGTILVDGSPNNGAHFTVVVPIKENQPSRKAETVSEKAADKAFVEI